MTTTLNVEYQASSQPFWCAGTLVRCFGRYHLK
jgi:hypothetical protein